jgi:hypothetical protein
MFHSPIQHFEGTQQEVFKTIKNECAWYAAHDSYMQITWKPGWKNNRRQVALHSHQNITVSRCNRRSEFGKWHFEKIGPFQTFGGYDWSTIQNVHFLDHVRDQPRVPMINAYAVGMTDGVYNIPYPPLHLHHFEVHNYGVGQDGYLFDTSTAFGFTNDCVCVDGASSDCWGVDMGRYVLNLRGPLWASSDINDVRPTSQQALQWWYHTAVHLIDEGVADDSRFIPLSTTISNAFSPGCGPHIRASTSERSFYLSVGRFPRDGQLVWMQPHSHPHTEAWWLDGTPASLNLTRFAVGRRKHHWCTIVAGGVAKEEVMHSVNPFAMAFSFPQYFHETESFKCLTNTTDAIRWGVRTQGGTMARCKTWSFRASSQYTLAVFADAYHSPSGVATEFNASNTRVLHVYLVMYFVDIYSHADYFAAAEVFRKDATSAVLSAQSSDSLRYILMIPLVFFALVPFGRLLRQTSHSQMLV